MPSAPPPLPGSQSAGTTAWTAQGAAGQGTQIAAAPPPSSYTPPQPSYPPPGAAQSAYPPATQQAALPPAVRQPPLSQAPPPNPYAAMPASGGQQTPLRPPPPPISPALPAMTGGDPVAEARMRAASVGYDPVAEARWRTTQAGGQQVGLILFPNGSAQLNPADKDLLQRVAAMARQSGATVRVVGHASSRTGEMDMGRHQNKNLDISMARANAAAGELRAAGMPAGRVVVEAKGDSEPVYRETMPSGEAGNRRVDVYLQ
jgi:flagellar motor protein MotB